MAYDSLAPRKPFVARGSKIKRCSGCFLPAQSCVCSDKPNVKAAAVFWLLTHNDECYKPTNTGRLIVDAIQGSRVFKWSRTNPDSDFMSALSDQRYAPCIVFPSGDGYQQRMVESAALTGKTPAFIILDGTWRQARRMFRLSRYLDHLPVIEPGCGAVSRYQLRQSAEEHHLCTAEVAAAMLREVQDHSSADVLDAYFDLFNAEYYTSRRGVDMSSASTQARQRLLELKEVNVLT
ncbi:tRNA-uridine aminocarboxypropyltransferase [Neptunomonas sp.]|uniref:tRNA-uridine aminocarboxypropyltransferase n=1 Tax=Neptunomonas sp. TaxID=1971898 RepID=UPI003564013C